MPAMTIRKLSEAAAKNMKVRAKANGRSVEAEARLALEEKFAPRERLKTAADAVGELKREIGGGVDLPVMPRSRDAFEPALLE